MKTIRFWLVLSSAVLVSACSDGLRGTYSDPAGVTSYDFHDDGRVDISVLGVTVQGNYEINKDRVLVTAPQGTVVFVRTDNGLEGPMGLRLLPVPTK